MYRFVCFQKVGNRYYVDGLLNVGTHASTIAGLAFPGYMTFRALETYDPSDEKQVRRHTVMSHRLRASWQLRNVVTNSGHSGHGTGNNNVEQP